MNLRSIGVLVALCLAVAWGATDDSSPRTPIQRPRLRPKLSLATTTAALPVPSENGEEPKVEEQEVEQVKETTVAPPPTTTFRSLRPTTKRRNRSTTTASITTTTAATSTAKSRSSRRKNNSRRRSSTAAPEANSDKLAKSQDAAPTTTKASRSRSRSRGNKRTSTTTTETTTTASTTTKRSRSRSRNRSRTKSTTAAPVEGVIIDATTRSSRRSKTRKGQAARVTSQPKTTTQRTIKSKPTTVATLPPQKTSFNEDFIALQKELPESPRAQTQLPMTESSSAGSLPFSSPDPSQPNPYEWEIKWASGDSQSGANSQLGVQDASGLPGFFPHINPQISRATTFPPTPLFNSDMTSLPFPQQTRPVRPLPLSREDPFFQIRDSAALPKDADSQLSASGSSVRPPNAGVQDQNMPLNPFPFPAQPFRPEGTERPQSKRPISVDNEPLIEPVQSTRAKSSTEIPRSSKSGAKSRDDIKASSTPLPVHKSKPSRGPAPVPSQPNGQLEKAVEFRRKPVETETRPLASKATFNKDSSSPRPILNPQDVEVVFPVRKLSPLPAEDDPLFSNNDAFSRSTAKPIENFTERQLPSSTLNSAIPDLPRASFEDAPRRKLKPFPALDGAIPDDLPPPPKSSFNSARRIPTEEELELNPVPVNRVRPSLSEYSFFPAQSRVNNEAPVVKSRRISDSVTASSITRSETVPSQNLKQSRDESARRKSGKDDEFRERLPSKSSQRDQSARHRSETADSQNDQRRNSNRDRSRSNAAVTTEIPIPISRKSAGFSSTERSLFRSTEADRETSVDNVSSKRRGSSNKQGTTAEDISSMQDRITDSDSKTKSMKDSMMQPGMMKDGMMKDGMMQGGMMKDGMMEDGMMKDGMMKEGMMKDGMMKEGMMKDGMMKDGMMKDGMMKDGMMEDGMMKDGMMQGGMMKDGMMKDGMMEDGMMKDGMMKDGMMKDGMMQGGMMKDGMMKDGMMQGGIMKDGMMQSGMMEGGMMEGGMMEGGMMNSGMMKEGMMEGGIMKDGMIKDRIMEDGLMKDGMMKDRNMKDGMMEEKMDNKELSDRRMMDRTRDGQKMMKGDVSEEVEGRIFREPVRGDFDRSQNKEILSSRRQKESGRVLVEESVGSRSKSRTSSVSSTLPTVRKPVNLDNRPSNTGRFSSDVRSEDSPRQRNRDDSLDSSRIRDSKTSRAQTWNGETTSARSKSRNEDVPSQSRSNTGSSQPRISFDEEITRSSTVRTTFGSEDFSQRSKSRISDDDIVSSTATPENRGIASNPLPDFQNQRVNPTSISPALPVNQNNNFDPFLDPFNDRVNADIRPANLNENVRDPSVPVPANPISVQSPRISPVEPEQSEEEYDYDEE